MISDRMDEKILGYCAMLNELQIQYSLLVSRERRAILSFRGASESEFDFVAEQRISSLIEALTEQAQ